MAMHVASGSLVTPDQYSSRVLNHLGLVAGMYDELGLGDLIDQVIVQDTERRHISVGQAVKAMVLNGLGFTQRALYLTPQFFQDKPVERLLGPGIEAAQLNDDVLGRTLDALYRYGVTSLYSQLAAQAVNRLELSGRFGHLDSTSLHVDGDYASTAEDAHGVVRLCRGYSRDHRPDLNQVVLQLIVERQAALPLLMEPLSGNTSDKTSFRDTLTRHIEQLHSDFSLEYVVADSALYASETLQALNQQVWWITRVPHTLSLAQAILDAVAPDLMNSPQQGAVRSLSTVYADVQQRWLVVYSPQAHQRALSTLNQHDLKHSTAELKHAAHLSRQAFACEADALKALAAFEAGLQHTFVAAYRLSTRAHYQKGRPAQDRVPQGYHYHLELDLACRLEPRRQRVQRKSCFILASNQTDSQALSDEQLLAAYQDQQTVERGFRFLKDPLFMASTLFLKSPKRIMALMMVMTLCLMVYAALEYRIRQALAHHERSFPNQKHQPSAKPTARWVFQYFTGIHLLIIAQLHSRVLNLKEHHLALLALLGERYERLYAPDG